MQWQIIMFYEGQLVSLTISIQKLEFGKSMILLMFLK